MTVKSPCVRNCCLDEDDVCMGCFRTIDEIIHWGSDESIDRQVLKDVLAREEKHRQKHSLLPKAPHDF